MLLDRVRPDVWPGRVSATGSGRPRLVVAVLLAVPAASWAATQIAPAAAASPATSHTAGAGWQVQHTPAVLVPVGRLAGVSCPTSSLCAAVGSGENLAGATVPLTELWNVDGWKLSHSPTPVNAAKTVLLSVSCVSGHLCVAVGNEVTRAGRDLAVSEIWTGVGWRVVPTAVNEGAAVSSLESVSCTTAAGIACVAVGEATIGSLVGALAETWNGKTWSITSPPGAAGSNLMGVACLTTTSCTAVGSSAGGTLAETWNGKAWTVVATPPASGPGSVLASVSCAATSQCTAVGHTSAGASLAEGWDGEAWTIQTTPSSGSSATLAGVSCTAVTACTAVGTSKAGTLAEVWDGATWTVQQTPDPNSLGDILGAVSCLASAPCVAVGYGLGGKANGATDTLAEATSSSGWVVQGTDTPTAPGLSQLSSVSCTSPVSCEAVGSYATSAGTRPLAEGWDGKSWKLQPSPEPNSATVSALDSVSCASSESCVAVGTAGFATHLTLIAETWNGVNGLFPRFHRSAERSPVL